MPVGGLKPPLQIFTVRSLTLRYAVAIAAVIVGWLVRQALTPSIGPNALPYITFFPAVAWAAWYGGLGPGILAITLASFVSDWFYIEPRGTLRFENVVAFIGFPVAAGLILAAIEAMHRARSALARTRDTLATTLKSIGDGVVLTDLKGNVSFLNPEAERLTGWKVDEARHRPLSEVFRIVNERTRVAAENPVEKVLKGGQVVGLADHTLLIARDGTETPIDDSAAPIAEPGQSATGVVLVFRDVREQRQAEATRARLAAIVESSGDAIVSKDVNGIVLTWNAAAERLFEYPAAEIVGKSILTLIPPEHREEEKMILQRLHEGRGSELIETTRVTKGGRRIPVSVRISPLRNNYGEVVGASKTVRDLSPLVEMRDALWHEKELLTTTLESIGDAVIITNADGVVTFLNPIAEELTGWTRADASEQPLREVFNIVNETTRAEVENPALRAMRDGVIIGLANHTVLIARDGAERAIDDSAAPIRDGHGQIVGSVLVFRDVTARRRTDRALQEADQRKNEFLATLAHELRNPLAPIRNAISLFHLKAPADRELTEARDVIDRQVDQMSRLLDDLLDVNRLDRKKLQIRKETVALSSVIASAFETARPGLQNRGHRVSVQVPDDLIIEADPLRLSQVFANLLNNAVKYTDDGGTIAVQAVRDGDAAEISVSDSGVGIAPESIPGLFEMFSQVPQAPEHAQTGLGIGLSLAKGLVELHGGTITAQSKGLGKGSVFTVRLPIVVDAQLPDRSREDGVANISTPPRRIIIADDVRDNADTLAMVLRAYNHTVEVAYDGAEAVALAERFRPEVAVFDLAMPMMNGFDACREIRKQPWGKSIYMIAQTGWGQEEDRNRSRDAGFDLHLLKPVESATLIALLAALPGTDGVKR
jgi:PAS domain S-box-containing protein